MNGIVQQISRLPLAARVILGLLILVPLIVVVMVFLAGGPLSSRTSQTAAVDIIAYNRGLAEGDAFLAEGRYEEALVAYDQAAQSNPVSAAPVVKRGNVYLAQGNVEQALAEYEAALRNDSTYALAHYQIAEIYRTQGDEDAALAQYQRALRVDPAFADAQIQIGGIYQAQGDLVQAAQSFNEALRTAVNDPRARASALTRLGNLEAEQGKQERAVARYQQAQQEDPAFSGSYLQLGQIYLEQEDLAQALEQFQIGVQAAPANADLRFFLGQALSRLGRLDEADVHLQEAIRLNQLPGGDASDHRPYLWLGQNYLARNLPQDAVTAYQQGLEQAPENRDLRMALAEAYRQQAQFPQAIAEYETLIAADPQDTDAYAGLGVAYQEVGDLARARETFDRLLAESADDPRRAAQVLTRFANTARDAGDLEEALSLYQEAIDADPTYVGTYLQLGFLYEQRERYDDAQAIYQKAVEVTPGDADAHLKLGQAYLRAGSLDEAVDQLGRASELNPRLQRAYLDLGQALELQGRPAQATTQYERAVEINPNDAEARFRLGQAYRQAGALEDAVEQLAALQALPRAEPWHAVGAIQLAQAYNGLARYDEAVQVLEQTLAAQPGLAESDSRAALQFQLAEVSRLRGDLAGAEEQYLATLEIDPAFADAQLQLAGVYEARGDLEAAAAAFARVSEMEGAGPAVVAAALTRLGNLLSGQGLGEEAVEQYRQAIAADPAYNRAYLQLGALQETEGDLESALATYGAGVNALPEDAELRLKLGLALRQSGRPDEAAEQVQQLEGLVERNARDWQSRLALGTLYEAGNQMVQALDQYSQTVQLVPYNPDVQFRLGQAYRKAGQAQDALDAFDRLLQLPGGEAYAGAYVQMGMAHEALGQLAAAEAQYQRAIELSSGSQLASAHFQLGDLYRKQGRIDEAIDHLEQALSLDPTFTEARLQLGVAYQAAGDTAKAQEVIVSVVDDSASNSRAVAQAYTKLGDLAQAQGDVATAQAQYQAAKDADPTYANAFVQQGLLYEADGRVNEAQAEFLAAIAADPGSAEAHFRLGKAYRQAGRIREAIAELERAAEISPGYIEVYLNLSQALLDIGDQEQAEVIANRAYRLAPSDALASRALTLRGDLLRSQRRYPAAIDDFTEAIRLDPTNLAAYVGLGETYRVRGELESAIQHYQAALDVDDTYSDAYIKMGHAYRDAGQYEQSLASYDQAIALQPTNAWYRILLGDGYLAAGQPGDALAAYAEGADIQADYQQQPWYHMRQADAYLAQGDTDAALAAAEEAEAAAGPAEESGAADAGTEGPILLQGDILLGQERWQEAADRYRTVLVLNPQRAQAMRGLALALEALGQAQDAIIQWQSYLRQAPNGEYADEARLHLRQLSGG